MENKKTGAAEELADLIQEHWDNAELSETERTRQLEELEERAEGLTPN